MVDDCKATGLTTWHHAFGNEGTYYSDVEEVLVCFIAVTMRVLSFSFGPPVILLSASINSASLHLAS